MEDAFAKAKYMDMVITTVDVVGNLTEIMDNAMPNYDKDDYTINVNMNTDLFIRKVREVLDALASSIVNCHRLIPLIDDDQECKNDTLYALRCIGMNVLRMNDALSVVEKERGLKK